MSEQPLAAQLSTNAEPAAEAPGPSELLCPHCDYNLIGSPVQVCPECGQPFNRSLLEHWAMAEGRLVPCPQLDGREWELGPILMSVFTPSRLGRLLSPRPHPGTAFKIGLCLRGLSVLPTTLVVMRMVGPETLEGIFYALPGIFVGSLFTEWVIAALLTWMVTPLGVRPGETWRFWRCCCHLFSTHLVISSCWIALLLLLRMSGIETPDPFAFLLLTPVPPFLLWWFCLARAIRRRGLPCIGRAVAQACIPGVGLIGLIVGFIVAGFAAQLIH